MNLEVFTNKAKEESAKSLFELVWSTVKDLGKKGLDKIQVEKASKVYFENYLKRNGKIKVLGMLEPVSLLDVYTSVRIIYPKYLHREKEIEELEYTFRKERGDFGFQNERISGIKIANEKKKLNILGAPGSGKSTFLKRIGLEALLNHNVFQKDLEIEQYKHNCIPVLIELKRFRNENINITKAIQVEFEIAGFPESEDFVLKSLKEGKFLILLDGIDEVPKSLLESTIEHIKDFTDRYDKNRFITSCRTAFYKTFLKDFTDVEIASFDDLQISKFVDNWFRLEKDKLSDTSLRFKSLLFEPNNKAILEIARTPLLLTFLCLTFDESQRFPSNRSNLYKRALYILLERWAAEKRIHNEDIYQNLTSDLEIEMLSEAAATFYSQDKIFFYKDEIKSCITSFLENTLNTKVIPFSKIIEAIEVQQGLLVQRAPEIYSFSHLTIQEYLTAHYYNSPKKLCTLIEHFLMDNRWREVFLLLAGMSNGDDFLILILEYLDRYCEMHLVLKKSINWVNAILPESDNIEQDAIKRVFLVSLLLRFKRYDSQGFSSATRLESYALKLIDSLDVNFNRSISLKENISPLEAKKALKLLLSWGVKIENYSYVINEIDSIRADLPLSNMLHGSRQRYRKKILSPFYKSLDVPENFGQLKRNQYDPILNYLEAFLLLMECKNASLRVSKDTWKKICLSLLK